MAKYLRMELGAGLTFDDRGELRFVNTDGKILTDDKGRDLSPLEEDDVRLLTDGIRESHPGFWPRAVGTGAVQGTYGRLPPSKPDPEPAAKPSKPAGFGLK